MGRHLPIYSATVARLLFFGGRYISLLLVARLLGKDAAGFLLAVAIVEVLRVVFDYGLENSVLARSHQKEGEAGAIFTRGIFGMRLVATLAGQVLASALIAVLCWRSEVPLAVPLVASLQFGCLMLFGYLQARLQTGRPGGMASLVLPLAFAMLVQALLLWLSYQQVIGLQFGVICFELMAVLACMVAVRKYAPEPVAQGAPAARLDWAASRRVLVQVAPLGNIALIGIAYNRLDAFAVSLFAGGSLLVQYLIYQRVASAPLMFFSTVASASISALSATSQGPDAVPAKVVRYRQLAYAVALLSGCALAAASPLIERFFALGATDQSMLAVQSCILALQIANGFHAAMLIAHGKVDKLWLIAKRNAFAALLAFPLCLWAWQGLGIAIALCIVEAFCAAQHAREFHHRGAPPEKHYA